MYPPEGRREWQNQDEARFAYLRRRGYRVIALWENDIRERGVLALLQETLGDYFEAT